MLPIELEPEISSMQSQLDVMKEQFDDALRHDVQLSDAKKLFHEIRILQARLDELTSKNSSNS
jgi:chemotaxis regulatin CheY-phosphate phosphatase CheZ